MVNCGDALEPCVKKLPTVELCLHGSNGWSITAPDLSVLSSIVGLNRLVSQRIGLAARQGKFVNGGSRGVTELGELIDFPQCGPSSLMRECG